MADGITYTAEEYMQLKHYHAMRTSGNQAEKLAGRGAILFFIEKHGEAKYNTMMDVLRAEDDLQE